MPSYFSFLLFRQGRSKEVRGLALAGEQECKRPVRLVTELLELLWYVADGLAIVRPALGNTFQEQRKSMRKLIWCCLAAAVLMAGSFLSLAYYACRCPDSVVGRSMQVIAEASIALQPLNGLTSLAARANQAYAAAAHETTPPNEVCIPDEPQPVAPELVQEPGEGIRPATPGTEREFAEAAPIVIDEDDPMPRETADPVVAAPIEVAEIQKQEIPLKGCPVVMPYCRDEDDEAVPPPAMPRTETGEESEESVFKAWIELFKEGKENKKDKSSVVEQLPSPAEEEPQAEPKCQEDSHLHEHYPGCPRTTCPYRSKGKEESSEEPPHPSKKLHKEEDPRTKGVDTMEYRPSDAGLDEYGPGPVH